MFEIFCTSSTCRFSVCLRSFTVTSNFSDYLASYYSPITYSNCPPGDLLAIPGNQVIGKRNPVISTRAARATHACMRPSAPVPRYFLRDAQKLAVALALFKQETYSIRSVPVNHYAILLQFPRNNLLL